MMESPRCETQQGPRYVFIWGIKTAGEKGVWDYLSRVCEECVGENEPELVLVMHKPKWGCWTYTAQFKYGCVFIL